MRSLLLALIASCLVHLCAQPLPEPQLVFDGTETNGAHFKQYKFSVTNYADYPADLFLPAPDLPPCGRNQNSSRTWVSIFDDEGKYVYGFCALAAPAELRKLWFALPEGTAPPKQIKVVITDRKTGQEAQSRLDIPQT